MPHVEVVVAAARFDDLCAVVRGIATASSFSRTITSD
jgi:hypothetical protein